MARSGVGAGRRNEGVTVSIENNNDMSERRGAGRIEINGVDCRLVTRTRVKLLDLSLSGALIASDVGIPNGAVARLSTVLGVGYFAPVVEVLRSAPCRQVSGRELGVQFQRMDDRSRKHLESFLTRAAANA